jgi:hypothetical protein
MPKNFRAFFQKYNPKKLTKFLLSNAGDLKKG